MENVKWFWCKNCNRDTKHEVLAEHFGEEKVGEYSWDICASIIQCCGCENLALVYSTNYFEDEKEKWNHTIYPPVSARPRPEWFVHIPDKTLMVIFYEVYEALKIGSKYLVAFGSRTLIDRLIVLTVGDKGNLKKGLNALKDAGKIADDELKILEPVIDAGNAAAGHTRKHLRVIR